MGKLRHFYLILRKNWLIRKRHFMLASCEVTVPIILFLVLAAVSPPQNKTEYFQKEAKVYDIHCQRDILSTIEGKTIAYAPSTPFTNKLMTRIVQMFNDTRPNITGYDTEEDVVQAHTMYSSPRGVSKRNIAAVVFEETDALPGKLVYKIRLQPHLHNNWNDTAPTVEAVSESVVWVFSAVQMAVDKAYTSLVCTNCSLESLPEISAQPMPYPPYDVFDESELLLGSILPNFLVLSFLFTCPTILKGVVNEKETGVKELLKMMGLSEIINWLGWMINAMGILAFSIAFYALILTINFSNKEMGRMMNHTDPLIFVLFLFLYEFASIAFCFTISSLIHRPTLAMTIGIILWLVSYYGPIFPLMAYYKNLSLESKMLASLIPNLGMAFGIKVISLYESRGVKLKWSTIYVPGTSCDNISLMHILIMLTADIFVYLGLTWYISSVMPGKYGVAKPLGFLFSIDYWCPRKYSSISTGHIDLTQSESKSFEDEPIELPVGIAVKDLYKEFRTLTGVKVAVDRISMNIYEGQITVVLGPNGAGKTTLISILTGLFSPTIGTALINGYDITASMSKIRCHLSICPQYNMLFSTLSVRQHLELFGMLKGLSKSNTRFQGDELLDKLSMLSKSGCRASKLSRGEKRKLSVAIALIGSSRVVMLDEPTTGMDPESRRAVWDLILSLRGKLTILITTHSMEEADILGDRIAIIVHGRLQCCGSTSFLKKLYGAGHHLKVCVSSTCDINLVQDLIIEYVEGAHVEEATENCLYSYLLPSDSSPKFPRLFAALEGAKEELGIRSFGVYHTTMEEVILKVGDIADKEMYGYTEAEKSELRVPSNLAQHMGKEKTRVKKLSQQAKALYLKCVLSSARRPLIVIVQALFPILLTVIFCYKTLSQPLVLPETGLTDTTSKLLSLDDLVNFTTIMQVAKGKGHEYEGSYRALIGNGRIMNVPEDVTLTKAMVDVAAKDVTEYLERYVVGARMYNDSEGHAFLQAMFSLFAPDSAGISLNLVNNAVLHRHAGLAHSITTYSHPLTKSGKKLNVMVDSEVLRRHSLISGIAFGVSLFIGLSMLSASFVASPVQEKASHAKQLLLMTGVHPLLYWLTAMTWDLFQYFITVAIMMTVIYFMDEISMYTGVYELLVLFLMFMSFGFSGISSAYAISCKASTVSGAFTFMSLIHIAAGIISSTIMWRVRPALLLHILRFSPSFPLCFGLMQYSFLVWYNNKCKYIGETGLKVICEDAYDFDSGVSECCENYCKSSGNCVGTHNYLTWKVDTNKLTTTYNDFGVGEALFFMVLDGLLYTILLTLFELNFLGKLLHKATCPKNPRLAVEDIEADVLAERIKVEHDVKHKDYRQRSTLLVDGLSKYFGKFHAVRGISFMASPSECFGLLGVNGAGKTTTFRMLTGDLLPSWGSAYILGKEVTKDRRKYLSSIGYCPQYDGLIDTLTGMEMLELFAKLRGISPEDIKMEVESWVWKLRLTDHINRPCGTYNPGNKRKLSTAIAMIGDPPVIFLDEPTSGVDPASRRNLWTVLEQLRHSGQAIVFTSHSMDECEALCSRVAIMVNGQFHCMGGPQELKEAFGQGFIIEVKVKQGCPPMDTIRVKHMVEAAIRPCMLQDERQGLLQYHVTNPDITWAYLYKTLESIKRDSHLVQDYSVRQTTLEQVFLLFAKKQEDENVSLGINNAVRRWLQACCCASKRIKVHATQ